jgi:hypothetical protein
MFYIKNYFSTTPQVRYSSTSTDVGVTLFNLAEVSQAEVLKFLNGKSGIYKWTNIWMENLILVLQ